jgi:murein DD-endopeptidase MepM/ murein hydrolase activator NlpD
MQEIGMQGLMNHPAAESFVRPAARFEGKINGAGASGRNLEELKAAARELESLFAAYLLKVMRETIEESGLFDESMGKSIYTELFDQEVARVMTQRGGFGIADLLVRQLAKPDAFDPVNPDAHSPEAPVPSELPSVRPDASSSHPMSDSDVPDFMLPVHAAVSSPFGIRKDPFTQQLRFHRGVDLAAPQGTPVLAALEGRVVYVGTEKGYGNTVVVEHGRGFRTRYAHLAGLAVRAGDNLKAQQLLGTVGSTGRSTGPHLHFEITQSGECIDPRASMAE